MKQTGIVLLLVLLLAGCAPIEFRKEIELKPGDGGVVVRVVPPLGAPLWTSVIVEREIAGKTEGEAYSVGVIKGVTSTSFVFAGSLPPGTYKVNRVHSSVQCAYRCSLMYQAMSPLFSKFEVKSGQLTDLGAILDFDGIMSHEVSPDHDLTVEFVQEMVPALRPLLTAPVLGWKTPTQWPGVGKFYELSRLIGSGVAPVKALDDVNYLSGSSTGIVYTFAPGHGRSFHDLGTTVSVDAVLPLSSRVWLAGGELGVLAQSRDAGQSWESIRGNLAYGAIVGLDHWKDNVLVTLARENQVKVFSAKEGEKNWELLASYQRTPAVPIILDTSGKRPQSFLVGDNLVTTLPGAKMAVLDLQRRASEVRDLPGSVMDFSVTWDGKLRCRCVNVAAFHYDSDDLGKTWVDSKVQRGAAMHVFRNERRGIGYLYVPFGTSALISTDDGGVTWRETLPVSHAVNQIFYNKDKTKAYAVSDRTAYTWMSTDDGEHWQQIQAPKSK